MTLLILIFAVILALTGTLGRAPASLNFRLGVYFAWAGLWIITLFREASVLSWLIVLPIVAVCTFISLRGLKRRTA